MHFLVGVLVGLSFGVLWGRVFSPRTSWPAFFALFTLTALSIWFTIEWSTLAALVAAVTQPLVGAYFLKQEDGLADLPCGERLQLWASPKLRRSFLAEINEELNKVERQSLSMSKK